MFDGLKKILRAPEAKASRTAKVLAFGSGGRARWTPRDYAALAREGYLGNAIVHRAVRLIAENAASCNFLVYEGAMERDAHPLLQLLTKPNARQDGASFFEALYAHMLLAGNAYVEAVALGDQVRELHALRPDRMKVVPGHDGWAEAYEYSVAGRSVRFDQLASDVPPILHLTFFHPLDDHYGLAPVEAAAVAIDAAIQIGVLDTDRTAPPSTPAEGDRHIVASGATGAWVGQAKAVAFREDGTWRFLTPKLGWCAWSDADSVLLVYDGTAWIEAASGGGSMGDSLAQLGINDTASDPNLLTVRSNAALFNAVDVADGGTGDMRVQISKESSTKIASVVFSNAFSGRAEFGLVGSDAFKLKVSNDGSSFVEAITFDQSTGSATLQHGVSLTGVISPSQINSNQNDYAPSGFAGVSTLRLLSDTSRNVTGLAGGADGRTIICHNIGAQNIVLTDQDSASTAANRFLFGANVTLAANASLALRYDGTTQRWRAISLTSSAGGGGGAAGMTDTERRNFGLCLIYQSKSFAEYRRLVNVFATGFKGASDALNGVNTGASSNYAVDSSGGKVSPSAGSSLIAGATGTTVGNMTASGGNAAAFNDVTTATRSNSAEISASTSGFVGKLWSSAKIIGRYTVYSPTDEKGFGLNSGGNLTLKLQGSSDTTTGTDGTWTDLHSDTFAGVSVTSQVTKDYASGISMTAAYAAHRVLISTTASSGLVIAEADFYDATINNMTLVTASQSTDSSVSNARVLIEYDNTAAPTLNTDLTVEVSCNGGATWATASLSAVTSYSQGGRKVAETVDQACTSGTSFAARIKTLNNKNVPVYGFGITAH